MMSDNDNKDKRFSQVMSTIDKGRVAADKEFLAQLREFSAQEFERCSVRAADRAPAQSISIWRTIMKSRITIFAAASILIVAILIVINPFKDSVGRGSVAFGEVLEYFQRHSYAFDLSIEPIGQERPPVDVKMQAKVLESGKIRFDNPGGPGVGDITSIIDFHAGRTLLLFHWNKTAVFKDESVPNQNSGAAGILAFCTKPIENLWNLRDGSEERLGEKEIDGNCVTGFRVSQEDAYFAYEITIWVDCEDGFPRVVEEAARPFDKSYPDMKWVMENFDLDAELDEGLFSLELPAGYTAAYQEDLEDVKVWAEPSVESEKVVRMLELWSEGKENDAIELLLAIDWSKPMEFGARPYIFSLSEKGYIALKAEDQKQAMEEIMATASNMRELTKEAAARGKAAAADRNYQEAERYFDAAYQFGYFFSRNAENMVLARLVGIAMQKLALKEMIELYKTMNHQEKLQESINQLQRVEAEADEIKRQIREAFG